MGYYYKTGVVRVPGDPELSQERGLERPLGGDGTCHGRLHKSNCRLFSQNTRTESLVTLYALSGSESRSAFTRKSGNVDRAIWRGMGLVIPLPRLLLPYSPSG